MKKQLHIAFVDFDDIKNPLLNGGQARATYEVARRLVKLGHTVTILTNKFPGSKDGYTDGIYYKHFGIGSKDIRINNVGFFLSLPFVLWNFEADVIIECFTAPISTCFSPLFTRIPVIGMPTMFEAEEFAKKYHIPFHWIEKLGTKFYRYFLAYSPSNKEKMARLNAKVHTRIIPNGVGEEFFTYPTKKGSYAFFIGRIDIAQKGLDLFMDALEKIKHLSKVKYVIAGNGPAEEEEKLRTMIKTRKLSGLVEYVGRCDGKRKYDYIANCLFGLYPSRWEDFPLVPLEFASMGKPLVCFDIKGLAWVPDTAAVKAKSFDADSLAGALLQVSKDAALYKKLSGNAVPFAKKYCWDGIAKQYAEFCQEVVDLEKARNRASNFIKGGNI